MKCSRDLTKMITIRSINYVFLKNGLNLDKMAHESMGNGNSKTKQ